jgi:serine/threonine protein kinase
LVIDLKTGKEYAMKYMKSDSKNVERELFYGKQLDYSKANLVHYIEDFEIGSMICMIMEYFEDGDLKEYIKLHKEKNEIFKELV